MQEGWQSIGIADSCTSTSCSAGCAGSLHAFASSCSLSSHCTTQPCAALHRQVYEYASMLEDGGPAAAGGAHYPVLDLPFRSKLAAVTWNTYLRSHLLAADYSGICTLVDASAGVEVRQSPPAQRLLLCSARSQILGLAHNTEITPAGGGPRSDSIFSRCRWRLLRSTPSACGASTSRQLTRSASCRALMTAPCACGPSMSRWGCQ